MTTSKNQSGLSTHQKALDINLNGGIYGTFAEIGAGQEVVRWFFRVGGAAGTVTKSISAYDMNVSDAIYGKSNRYVSKSRLIQMLDHEYSLNLERLSHVNRSLFAFADTIATQSYKGNNEPHGWMGLRFQDRPGMEPSQIILHIRMLDREAVTQQEALGIVGVNLIYAAFYMKDDPERFLLSLMDDLSSQRIQIDMIEFSGALYQNIDNRLVALYLVKNRLSEVAMFDQNGVILQPSEVLYKKPILIERGNFRPVTKMHQNILESAKSAFQADYPELKEKLLSFMEITMENLFESTEFDPADFLERADMLAAIEQPVIITHYPEFYRISSYLSRYTMMPRAFAVGGAMLPAIFNPSEYQSLEGGLMEAMSKLFRKNVKMYVYPQKLADGSVLNIQTFKPDSEIELIYEHLAQQGFLKGLEPLSEGSAIFNSRDIIQRMKQGDASWKKLVPEPVVNLIEERKLFDTKS